MKIATLVYGSENALLTRDSLVEKGKYLERLTLLCCIIEAVVGLISGVGSHSVSLLGFGFDSLIETVSALAITWRLQQDHHARHAAERISLRVIGVCFFVLAIYVGFAAISALLYRKSTELSLFGVGLTLFSIVVMPALARAKHGVARLLESAAIQADAQQSAVCGYLAMIVLSGLIANGWFGFWWTDPVASLCMVPLIIVEGRRALAGKSCPHC